ncbi:8-oxo-dGTP diphosphatase [Novipirellula aureliae]|uniref:8-oxo-dGTP diphosphatase n=1 Tax=Novipirellula aureliae TaxID=2527966 RepID=A0A5C6E7H4_9BACT|nr:CoA pyrophosphatase [Novipirellula aureliae]TWU44902.1 8-oxo-dGTP diphosphatase [Novipirellula aureliae]
MTFTITFDNHRRDQRLCPMQPGLAYGRHRGPAPAGVRRASVAVCVYQNQNDDWVVPLTRRSTAIRHHAGQICFPGGKIERGENAEQAALREFEEELGLRPRVRERSGKLSRQYVYASDNLVEPMVFVIEPPDADWKPDPVEVAEVLLLPITELYRPESRVAKRLKRKVISKTASTDAVPRFLEFTAPAFKWGEYRIWGATAIILDELAQHLLEKAGCGSGHCQFGTLPRNRQFPLAM